MVTFFLCCASAMKYSAKTGSSQVPNVPRSALPHSAFRVQGMGRFGVTVVKYARAIVYSPSAMRALSSADCLCLRAKAFGAGALTYRRTAAAFAGFFEIGRTDRARKPVGLSMLQGIQGRAPRPP